jgi:hypothetical protein
VAGAAAPADHAAGDVADEALDDYVVYRPHLTVADGFRFGCGFMSAVAVFFFAVLIALTLVYLIASVLHLSVPGLAG